MRVWHVVTATVTTTFPGEENSAIKVVPQNVLDFCVGMNDDEYVLTSSVLYGGDVRIMKRLMAEAVR